MGKTIIDNVVRFSCEEDLYACSKKKAVLLNKKNLLEQISYIKAAHPSAETSDYFRGFHTGIDLIIGYIESQNE